MPVQETHATAVNFQKSHAQNMIRLRDPKTGVFLHMSGNGSTKNSNYAWMGYRYQAETLESRAKAKGEQWPYSPVHRSILEPVAINDQPERLQ